MIFLKIHYYISDLFLFFLSLSCVVIIVSEKVITQPFLLLRLQQIHHDSNETAAQSVGMESNEDKYGVLEWYTRQTHLHMDHFMMSF